MAERPIFIPDVDAPGFVREIACDIQWAGGFASTQKRKNIKTLHEAAASKGFAPLLEVSTKSDEVAGRHLSAFHLKVDAAAGPIPLECAFQGSKVFEGGGPFTDLLSADPAMAKRDPRLQNSGRLIRFEFEGREFPLQPKTMFYDWLYLNSLFPYRDWLGRRLAGYAGFTDIEFNPKRSINCQARSCALFIALLETGSLNDALRSPEYLLATIAQRQSPTVSQQTSAQLAFLS